MRLLTSGCSIAEPAEVLGVDDKPAKTPDAIEKLITEYNVTKLRLEKIATYCTDQVTGDMEYFMRANVGREHRSSLKSAFALAPAIKALDATFWQKAMCATDVYDVMPQKRRDEWNELIEKMQTPEFTEQTVRDTLAELLASRAKFLGERVDGIFRALSGEHVTNRPEGFGKRFIMNYVLHYGDMVNHSKVGHLDDLRCVIAKFMKRDECKHGMSASVVETCKRRYGEWVVLDGGALKIRVYRKGTAHMEVHPDMAWRLNTILASLYPKAIPAQFRKRSERKTRTVDLIQRVLPFAVVQALDRMQTVYRTVEQEPTAQNGWRDRRKELVPNCLRYDGYSGAGVSKRAAQEANQVLESLGGVLTPYGWQFDYPASAAISTVVASGVVPDDRAYQFYPTPKKVADYARKKLRLDSDSLSTLEPSAGLGHLAATLVNVTLIEVSETRCAVLRAKGFGDVICADFLVWSKANPGAVFDRVLMNPPFDSGRWRAHLDAAAHHLKPGGRLVAILPIGAKKAAALLPVPEFKWWFKRTFKGAFAGVSIDTCVLVVKRRG